MFFKLPRFLLLCLVSLVVYCNAVLADPSVSKPCTCPNTTSLTYHGDGHRLYDTYAALTTCADITELDLRLGTPHGDYSNYVMFFDFKKGDRFPPLKSLDVSGYEWTRLWDGKETYPTPSNYQVRPIISWILARLAELSGYGMGMIVGNEEIFPNPLAPCPDTVLARIFSRFASLFTPTIQFNLDQWLKVQNFTALENLKIANARPYFFKRMKGELPQLRKLDVTLGWNKGFFTEFVLSASPLESLVVFSESLSWFPLDRILAKHGATLDRLEIASEESVIPSMTRQTLSPDQIQQIYAACPKLTHLTVDVQRDGTWPNDTLDALVSHPELTSLGLRLELGVNLHANESGSDPWIGLNPWTGEFPDSIAIGVNMRTGESFEGRDIAWRDVWPVRQPAVTRGEAERLFRYLHHNKVGKPLEYLEIEVGDAPKGLIQRHYGYRWKDYWNRVYRCGKGVVRDHLKKEEAEWANEVPSRWRKPFHEQDSWHHPARYSWGTDDSLMCVASPSLYGKAYPVEPGFDEDFVVSEAPVYAGDVMMGGPQKVMK